MDFSDKHFDTHTDTDTIHPPPRKEIGIFLSISCTFSLHLGSQRANIAAEFQAWLNAAHEKFDQQIRFSKPEPQLVTVPGHRLLGQGEWTAFKELTSSTTRITAGTFVRVHKQKIYVYSIVRFIVRGNLKDQRDMMHSRGATAIMELRLEPADTYPTEPLVYEKVSKLFLTEGVRSSMRVIAGVDLQKTLQEERARLPSSLVAWFPDDEGGAHTRESGYIKDGATVQANQPIGLHATCTHFSSSLPAVYRSPLRFSFFTPFAPSPLLLSLPSFALASSISWLHLFIHCPPFLPLPILSPSLSYPLDFDRRSLKPKMSPVIAGE